jgi:hypothetical protein
MTDAVRFQLGLPTGYRRLSPQEEAEALRAAGLLPPLTKPAPPSAAPPGPPRRGGKPAPFRPDLTEREALYAEGAILGQLALPSLTELIITIAAATGGAENLHLYPSGEIDGIVWIEMVSAGGVWADLKTLVLAIGDAGNDMFMRDLSREFTFWAYRLTYRYVQDLTADYMADGEDIRYAVVAYNGAAAKVSNAPDEIIHRFPVVTHWHRASLAFAALTAMKVDVDVRESHPLWTLESVELLMRYNPDARRPERDSLCSPR